MKHNSLSIGNLHNRNQNEHLFFQEAINQIMYLYYESDCKQDKMHLLTYIHEFTRSESVLCDSSHLVSLAILSNHLLQFAEKTNHSFLLANPTPIYIKELKATLYVKVEFGEWTQKAFKIRKFLWGTFNDQWLVDMITIYCYYAYINRPEKLEIIDLLAGCKDVYELDDNSSAIDRVKKQLRENPVIKGSSYCLISNKKEKMQQ